LRFIQQHLYNAVAAGWREQSIRVRRSSSAFCASICENQQKPRLRHVILALLNDAADRLNMEAADVLDYQAPDE
jgi:hypothetical protein